MKKYNKLMYLYFVIIGLVLVFYKDLTNLTMDVNKNLEYIKCGNVENIPRPFPQIISIAYSLLVVGTPIILIIFSIISLVKNIMSGTGEEIEKSKKAIFKKFVIALVIFFIGVIVRFTVNQFTSNNVDKETAKSCIKCFLYYSEDNCGLSDPGYNDNGERLKPWEKPNYVNSNIKKKSNKNSNGGHNTSSYGNFSGDEMHKIALHFYRWEGGLDSNGNPRYNDLSPCYNLTAAETSITIGVGGWFATHAKVLLSNIRDNHPDTFRRLDTANIADDVDNANWEHYCISRDSAKGKAIVNIISSPEGIEEQDKLILDDLSRYIDEAEEIGIKDKKAIMLYMNVRHIFGRAGTQQLLDKLHQPCTLDEMYSALLNTYKYNRLAGWTNRYKSTKEFAEQNL